MAHEIISITSGSVNDDETLKITIEGDSNMPFWNHVLKVNAILSLLNSIDVKQYYEDKKVQEADESFRRITESAKVAFGYDLVDFD